MNTLTSYAFRIIFYKLKNAIPGVVQYIFTKTKQFIAVQIFLYFTKSFGHNGMLNSKAFFRIGT